MTFDVLTPSQLQAVKQRQRAQQASWAKAPAGGVEVECMGETFIVYPNVFPPRGDTELLVSNMTLAPGSTVLDLGTGCGVLAIFAARQGAARVLAVDVNEQAVKNALANIIEFDLNAVIEARVSDCFSAVEPVQFDLIVANLPGRCEVAADVVQAAQWDTDFRAHRDLFNSAKQYLKPGGSIFMAKANYPELNTLMNLASTSGFTAQVLDRKDPSDNEIRTYYALSFSTHK